MNTSFIFALAVGIGVVAGLRSLTAPAAVAWGVRWGWLGLAGSPLAFMGTLVAVALFTLAAFGELVADKLPRTQRRTLPAGLTARLLMGALSGACLCVSAGQSLLVGAVLGGIGGVVGGFAGYEARTRLVRSLKVGDTLIAVAEDLVAIGLAFFLVGAA